MNKSEKNAFWGFDYFVIDQFTIVFFFNFVSAYGSSSLNSSMHGTLTGARGPFTPSQWFELEQQALIYKYINANVPVPAELIIPIRRSLASSGLSVLSSGSFASNSCKLASPSKCLM